MQIQIEVINNDGIIYPNDFVYILPEFVPRNYQMSYPDQDASIKHFQDFF